MSKNPRSLTDPRAFAVVHRTAGMWRVLVAQNGDGRLRMRDARSIVAEADGSGLDAYLASERVDRVIAVLPASSVVCRTCTLPDAEPAALEQALSLQSETYMLGTAETHRLATAVLPIAPGEASRTGIIVSWPESAAVDAPPVSLPVTYAPDIVALAALLNGYRPADPLIWVDRKTGAVALALSHASGAVLRATREEAASRDEWAKNATRVLAETALSVGHSPSFVKSLVKKHEERLAAVTDDGSALILPSEIVASVGTQIEDTKSGEAWWSQFGIAAGIAIAATGELAKLTDLVGERAVEKPSRVDSVVRTLSRPRAALVTCIVCLLCLALLPLLVSGLRLTVLRARHADIDARTEAIGHTENRLAMYSALESQTWSMTKLLSDVVSNTPEGIDLVSIRLQHSDESVAVSGVAKGHGGLTATEVIARMQELLRDSRLFGEIGLSWDQPTKLGVHEFELSAKIIAPHRRVRYATELDFANWTLADRQAGTAPPEADPLVDGETDPDDPGDDPGNDPGDDPDEALASAAGETGMPGRGGSESRLSDRSVDPPGRDATGGSGLARNTRRDPGVKPSTGASAEIDGNGDPAGSGTRPDRSRPSGLGRAADGAQDASKMEERTPSGPGPGAVPAALTEAQIVVMTDEEVKASLTDVARAKNRIKREDEPELHARLTWEFNRLMKRMREGK